MTNGLYFRVSSDRQTTQNQFEDLLEAAERDGSGRDWPKIRQTLDRSIYQEDRPTRGSTRIVCRSRPEVAAELARRCIYVEQGI